MILFYFLAFLSSTRASFYFRQTDYYWQRRRHHHIRFIVDEDEGAAQGRKIPSHPHHLHPMEMAIEDCRFGTSP